MVDLKAIVFQAILHQARTTVDGGWRITFDVSQDEANKIMKLSTLRELILHLEISLPKHTDSEETH